MLTQFRWGGWGFAVNEKFNMPVIKGLRASDMLSSSFVFADMAL